MPEFVKINDEVHVSSDHAPGKHEDPRIARASEFAHLE